MITSKSSFVSFVQAPVVGAFKIGKRYLAELFRKIKRSVSELFRQIKRSVAELFCQIKRSVAEHLEKKQVRGGGLLYGKLNMCIGKACITT